MGDYLSAGNKLFTPNWWNGLLIMSKDESCVHRKYINVFVKGKMICMDQGEKTSEEIAEATKIALRTVQRITKK